jgi:hypothetical protein
MRRIVTGSSALLAAAIGAALVAPVRAAVPSESTAAVSTHGRHYDARRLLPTTPARSPTTMQQRALDAFASQVAELRYEVDAVR